MTGSAPRRTPLRKKIVRLIIFALACVIVFFCSGYMAVYTYLMTRPARSVPCCTTPATWGAAYEDVAIQGDGVTLAGWYVPPPNGAVIILLHGYGGNRMAMWVHGEYLYQAGYGLLMLDLRAHGQSTGDRRSYGWEDAADMQGVVAFLQARPEVQHIGIFGHSVGGQIALRAAAQIPAIEAVVVDGPSTSAAGDIRPLADNVQKTSIYVSNVLLDRFWSVYLGIPIPAAVRDEIPRLAGRPVFFIAAGNNPLEADFARVLYDIAQEPKEFWVIPEAKHGGAWRARPDEYERRVITFFNDALLETP